MSYQQSRTLAEVQAKHPFPWSEQRAKTGAGVLVRLIDANGVEVGILEMTALCLIASKAVARKQQRPDEAAESPPQGPA